MPITLLLAQLLTPYEQANEQDLDVLVADTDILAAELVPTQTVKRLAQEAATGVPGTPSTAPCLFRIQICVDEAATFSARITKDGDTQPYIFNDDTDLTADAGYMFDLLVHDGDTVNFQLSAAVTIRNLRVQEITGAVQ